MKTIKEALILYILIITLLLTGCNKTTVKNKTSNVIKESNTNDSTSIYNIIDAFLDKLETYNTYLISIESNVNCSKGIVNYTQNTYETTVKKNNTFYTRTNSDSLFVKINTLTTYTNSSVLIEYKNKNEEYTINEYKEKRGYTPFDRLILGFIVNEETIISPILNTDDNNISISFDLDLINSSNLVGIQMKDYSNMKDIPSFTYIHINLLLTNDYDPIMIKANINFNASVSIINDGSFTEELTYVYSKINEEVVVPSF